MTSRIAIVFLTALLALVAGYAAYLGFLVPRLGGMNSVPLWIWLLLGAPFAGACIFWGWRAKSRSELLFTVMACAASLLLTQYVLAVSSAPGFFKSYAVEDPSRFWSRGVLLALVLSLVLCAFGGIAKRWAR